MKIINYIAVSMLIATGLSGCTEQGTEISVNTSAVTEKTSSVSTVKYKSDLSVTENKLTEKENESLSDTERLSEKNIYSLIEEQLEKSDYNLQDIQSFGQLFIVDSEGSSCSVYCFEKNKDGDWGTYLSSSGIVGKNGVSKTSAEGDGCTPEGMFALGTAFGTDEMSGLNVEYRRISDISYWVDDSTSPLYNQWVESSEITWKSAEHLIDYPDCYHYGVVINYNMSPVIPGKGSAIFLHCAVGTYTEGCVAVPENDMMSILKWLDSSCNPHIIIS